MASIDELHFEVILGHSQFDSEIKKVEGKAKELNADISKLLDIRKDLEKLSKRAVTDTQKVSGAQKEVTKETQKTVGVSKEWEAAQRRIAENLAREAADTRTLGQMQTENAKKAQDAIRKDIEDREKINALIHQGTEEQRQQTQELERTNAASVNLSGVLSTISQIMGVTFGIAGIRRFTNELIRTTGEFEVQKMALSSMLQDADKADEVFNTLRKRALESPYTFQDLAKYAKQLTAFNIPVDQLVETEKRLADVAAGLGVDMGRIILAYGQVKAAGALKGQELRQFTEAGVPILEQLAKQIEEVEGKAVSLSEVFSRVSKKQIPFEMVEEAFKRMTSEGGKFYNMQEVLVETLQGKISKLKDVWQQALYDLGVANEELLKGGVDAITKLVSNLDEIGKRIPELVGAWGAYATVQTIVEAGGLRLAVANSKVFSGLKAIGAWIAKNPYAILAAALTVLVLEVKRFYDEAHAGQKRLEKSMKDFDKALDDEKQKLGELNEKLKLNAKNTAEWNSAKEEAVRLYGQYFNGLDKEIEKTGNLETAYANLTIAIENSVRARQVADFQESEKKIWDEAVSGDFEKLRDKIYKKANTRAGAYRIVQEVNKLLQSGVTWKEGTSIRDNPAFQDLYGMLQTSITSGHARATILHAITSLAQTNRDAREEYLNNVRTLVKEYGFAGTPLDPDFNGPLPQAKKTITSTKQKEWGNDWNPLGGDKKGIVLPIIDIDAAIAEADRELAEILKRTTSELDEELDKRLRAMNSFDAFIDKWEHTKSEKTGEGAAFKVSTIIGDYKQADYKVLSEYIKQLKNLETQYGKNTAAYNNNKKKLDEWKKTMEQLNRADFVEKIRQLGEDFFKEGMLGYDLTNLGHKSLGQLLEIRDALDALDIPDDVKALLQDKYPDALEKLVNSLLTLAGQKKDKSLTPEIEKELRQEASFAAREISGLADSIEELAAASGDTKLAGLVSELKDVAGVASDALSAFEQFGGAQGGGYAAGWVAIVVGFAQMVLKAGLAQEAAMNRFVENSSALRSLIKTQSEDRSSIFGESDTSVISSRLQSLQKIRKDIDSYRGEESGIDIITQRYNWLAKVLGYLNAENWTGKSVGSGDYMVTDSVSKLSKLVEGLGLELYDKYGNLNADSLQAILDTYEDIGQREREWIEDAIQDSKDYAEVMSDVEDILSSIFGNIASDAADSIIDGWIEAGNAALDYADILDDVARKYAKMLIESAILDKVLNKDRAAEIADKFLSGNTDEVMSMIASDMEKIANLDFTPLMTALDPYFKATGGDSNSIGSGIKSITEDTASLLASYINAMRADLSYIRILQEKGWQNVESIAGVVTPSLANYVQQIAANTYNSAERTGRILSELQSVIGSPGSNGMVVRVETM